MEYVVDTSGECLGFFFINGPVHNFGDVKKNDTTKFGRFFQGMLKKGVYLAPSQFEAGFTSISNNSEDIERTLVATEKVMREI